MITILAWRDSDISLSPGLDCLLKGAVMRLRDPELRLADSSREALVLFWAKEDYGAEKIRRTRLANTKKLSVFLEPEAS